MDGRGPRCWGPVRIHGVFERNLKDSFCPVEGLLSKRGDERDGGSIIGQVSSLPRQEFRELLGAAHAHSRFVFVLIFSIFFFFFYFAFCLFVNSFCYPFSAESPILFWPPPDHGGEF